MSSINSKIVKHELSAIQIFIKFIGVASDFPLSLPLENTATMAERNCLRVLNSTKQVRLWPQADCI